MPPEVFSPTPYPDVNTVLKLLLKEAQGVLDNYFIGLYLHGSLALGDFNPGSSDIDFCIVTSRELPLKLISELEAAHQRINDSGLAWVDKLEGSYLSKKAVRRYRPEEVPHPHVWNKKFQVTRDESAWAIDRHILREHGVTVAGPPVKPLIDPVSPDELRNVIITGIRDEWVSKLNEPEWLKPPSSQPFVVLTCCRALYTMKFGTIVSKPVSARWAVEALGKQWKGLIETALAWHYGLPHGDIEQTLQFMRYTMEQIGALRPQQ
jgi:predicted nucleotidyltransferase